MKTRLLILILLMTTAAVQAQRALIRDSVLSSSNGGPFMPGNGGDGVTVHTPNHFCKDSVTQSSNNRSFYFYDSMQRLVENLGQYKYPNTDTFRNASRIILSYTPSGKPDTLTFAYTYNFSVDTFVDNSRLVYFYDANDFEVKQVTYQWNVATHTFDYVQGAFFYNDATGKADSAYIIDAASGDTTVDYYTYYPSGRQYQTTTYDYVSGEKELVQIQTVYHDSANYVTKDSIVVEGIQAFTDSFTTIYRDVYTNFYNPDGTVQESDASLYYNYFQPSFTIQFKTFYFYTDCSPAAFPVSFLSFSAKKQNRDAVLNWQTGSEINTSSFGVQRSVDGVHFTTVGTVSASGNGSQRYTFTDINVLQMSSAPKLYYRLAERDKDGSIQYSSIASLDIAAGKVLVTASPNPATNVVNVYSSVALNDAVITISDMRGRQVYSAKQNISAGSNVPVDVSAFAKGIYIVTVQSASYKQQVKIVKE